MIIKIRNTKKRVGPGNNIFKKDNVKLGKEIILKVNKFSSEIILSKLGYGIYSCEIIKPIFLPRGIVFGFFLYKNDQKEVDIEFSRWGKLFSKNVQMVIQEKWKKRFWNFRRKNKLILEWRKDFIKFTINNKTITKKIKYKDLKLHINLWTYNKQSKSKIKIRNLNFKK